MHTRLKTRKPPTTKPIPKPIKVKVMLHLLKKDGSQAPLKKILIIAESLIYRQKGPFSYGQRCRLEPIFLKKR
jgi:hypothetical protein